MNSFKKMIMNNSNTSEVEVWDNEKIAKAMPEVFRVSRAKNGERSLSVRRAPKEIFYQMPSNIIPIIQNYVMAGYFKATNAGEVPTVDIKVTAGNLQLNPDIAEFVITNQLYTLIQKGWTVTSD